MSTTAPNPTAHPVSAQPVSAPTGPRATAPNRALNRALGLDALASAVTGVLLAGGSGVLDEVLGIPSGWLLGLGVFMVVYAADVTLIASRGLRRFVPAVITGNAAWVLASVLLVLAGGFDLTVLGGAFVLAQAAAVAVLAVMQARALRG
ncbi:MAG TPA: hypothetical protein VMM13_01280 [Euzebya sp.]|nr:hypothetical protein [Euzebya sp.]